MVKKIQFSEETDSALFLQFAECIKIEQPESARKLRNFQVLVGTDIPQAAS